MLRLRVFDCESLSDVVGRRSGPTRMGGTVMQVITSHAGKLHVRFGLASNIP